MIFMDSLFLVSSVLNAVKKIMMAENSVTM